MASGTAPQRHSPRSGGALSGHWVEAVLLGMPVRIACACASNAAWVRKACVAWSGPCERSADPLAIELRRGVRCATPDFPRIEVSGERLFLSGAGIEAVADAANRTAVCAQAPEVLALPDVLLGHVLEPLGLFLATRNGRVPIHASGVQLDDLAILFTGPSGAGKSSLAMAASRAGITVISEDTIYVQREPRLAIWGWQGPIHLLAKDAGTATGPPRVRNGRVKLALDPCESRTALQPSTAATLCILQHGERVSLAPISQAAALAGLGPLEPGFDLLERDIEAALADLTTNGAWLLTLSSSPDEAIALVRQEAVRLRNRATAR
jgi:hypothetical protein